MCYHVTMKLSKWLKNNGLTQRDFRELAQTYDVNISTHAVTKWCNGQRIPRPREMKSIYLLTKGQVQPNDFYGVNFFARHFPDRDADVHPSFKLKTLLLSDK
tara:strand:+ start:6909 stop:7214 length:306 start_codon:yes stop_codon:yes gene_type:complete